MAPSNRTGYQVDLVKNGLRLPKCLLSTRTIWAGMCYSHEPLHKFRRNFHFRCAGFAQQLRRPTLPFYFLSAFWAMHQMDLGSVGGDVA